MGTLLACLDRRSRDPFGTLPFGTLWRRQREGKRYNSAAKSLRAQAAAAGAGGANVAAARNRGSECPRERAKRERPQRGHLLAARSPPRSPADRTSTKVPDPGRPAACGGCFLVPLPHCGTALTRSPRGTARARRGARASSTTQRCAATAREGEAAVLGASSRAAVHQLPRVPSGRSRAGPPSGHRP